MDFDIVVIGGGVGGVSAAIRAAELGKKVAIIEKDQIGGECINRACIPSKTLIDSVKIIFRQKKNGWIKGNLVLDYEYLLKYKNTIIEKIRSRLENNLNKYKVKIIKGKAKVYSVNEVKVDDKIITTDKIVIATGSEPIVLPDFPLNNKNVIDPWTAMNLPRVPDEIIIVGGGVAGVELATLFSAMGKRVTIIELMPQLLPGFDKQIAEEVKKRLEEMGVSIYVNAKSKLVKSDDKVTFSVNMQDSSFNLSADMAVVTIGRKPVTDGIDLKGIKVDTDNRGYIKVDERGRSVSNPDVYAVGDVTGIPLSATKAWRQGIVAGDNLGGRDSVMPKFIPISIFSGLEIGVIGKTLDDVKKMGINAKEVLVPMNEIPRAWTLNETEGFLKLVIDNNGLIYGAHMIGEGATEIINAFSIVMENGLKIQDLYKVTFSHPTLSEIISEAIQRATYGEVY
ncbi:MAG: NAD(P)/FAD-dependent oxidoreductase [Sulfolobaceae archaeon]|jgi:dihydrolipoamide dehydrogenase